MIDALDLELIEKSQPAHLKDLLQAVDLINVQIRVDRNNITGEKCFASFFFFFLRRKVCHDLDGKSILKVRN